MLDDFYNRKMQLAQLMSQRSPVFKQPMGLQNQAMQNEAALQQVNQQNTQESISDEKKKLAEALSGKQFTPATDAWGVANNLFEGILKGKSQVDAKEEQKKNTELEQKYKQQLAAALSGGTANVSELAKNPLVKTSDLVDFYKAQSSGGFGKSLTGQLAQDNYNNLVASGMSPEMARSAAIQQAINQAAVQQGNAVPSTVGNTPRQTQQQQMVPPPAPTGDLLGDQGLPDIPENGMVPTPTVAPTGAPQPPMTGVPYVDKINLQNWSDMNKEQSKANIDIKKTRDLERPKIELGLASARDALESTNKKIDEMLPKINSTTAGAAGTVLGFMPGTDAKDLKSNIRTLQARSAVDKLQEVRQASPTGGAFGNVSDKDMDLLQTIVANLENSQSPEQLAKNLNEFKTEYGKVYSRLTQGYKNTYGADFSGSKSKTINFNDLPD